MNPDILLGLQISLTGLAVTFLALGLVILVIRLLHLVFPGAAAEVKARMQPQPSREAIDAQQREETAVALAVAVALLEQGAGRPEQDPTLGRLLEPKDQA